MRIYVLLCAAQLLSSCESLRYLACETHWPHGPECGGPDPKIALSGDFLMESGGLRVELDKCTEYLDTIKSKNYEEESCSKNSIDDFNRALTVSYRYANFDWVNSQFKIAKWNPEHTEMYQIFGNPITIPFHNLQYFWGLYVWEYYAKQSNKDGLAQAERQKHLRQAIDDERSDNAINQLGQTIQRSEDERRTRQLEYQNRQFQQQEQIRQNGGHPVINMP